MFAMCLMFEIWFKCVFNMFYCVLNCVFNVRYDLNVFKYDLLCLTYVFNVCLKCGF